MTAQVADFIASREGAMWGAYCDHYGEHPGSMFDDEVIRFQVGMAYMIRDRLAEQPEEPTERPEGRIVTDLERQMR